MSDEVVRRVATRLYEFLCATSLASFAVTLHGGEPLFFSKKKMTSLLELLQGVGSEAGCKIDFRLQTNGILVDPDWVDIFKRFNINVTISLDGPEEVNDARRVGRNGKGTHSRVLQGISFLKKVDYPFSILAVYHPEADAGDLCRHFIDDLGAQAIDVLFPDFENVDQSRMATFYNELFDLWWHRYAKVGIIVRISYGIFNGLLRRPPITEALGRVQMSGFVVDYDGVYLLGDTISSLAPRFENRTMDVFSNSLEDFMLSPMWQQVCSQSARLPTACSKCEVSFACGGGSFPHRWSSDVGFDAPSKFCSALKAMYFHAAKVVARST